MAYSISPILGADLTNIVKGTDITAGNANLPGALGTEAFGSDGKLYVLAKANASITASTAVCTVNAGTFLATASGGSYTSPATNMVSGDFGWFSKASV
jgi:hypothetical protein